MEWDVEDLRVLWSYRDYARIITRNNITWGEVTWTWWLVVFSVVLTFGRSCFIYFLARIWFIKKPLSLSAHCEIFQCLLPRNHFMNHLEAFDHVQLVFGFYMFDYKVSTLTTILCVDVRGISQSSHHSSRGSHAGQNKRGFLANKVFIKLSSLGMLFFPDWKEKVKLLSKVFVC